MHVSYRNTMCASKMVRISCLYQRDRQICMNIQSHNHLILTIFEGRALFDKNMIITHNIMNFRSLIFSPIFIYIAILAFIPLFLSSFPFSSLFSFPFLKFWGGGQFPLKIWGARAPFTPPPEYAPHRRHTFAQMIC